jgi:hypothetical protein
VRLLVALTNSKGSKEVYAAKGWFIWSSVGKNDIAGAIGGALVGSAAGGVGARAAAGFVGGGIGTSVTDTVLQVINPKP